MKSILIILSAIICFSLISCVSTAPTQTYRPANSSTTYRVSGKLDGGAGFNGTIFVYVNGEEVIKKSLPVFTNSVEASGTYKGKPVTALITRVQNFASSFTRADVMINNERAATLTF